MNDAILQSMSSEVLWIFAADIRIIKHLVHPVVYFKLIIASIFNA
jgi:hypothetical protein